MKVFTFASLFILLSSASSNLLAYQYGQTGGFSGPGGQSMPRTVQAARNTSIFADGMYVTLTGVITESLGNEWYTFRDNTGKIKIEIDNDDWYGLNVTPNVTVVINGEIEKGIFGTSIEVERIYLK